MNDELNNIDTNILKEIAGIDDYPKGAFNIRKNGQGIKRNVTENISIVTKKDKPGIDIFVKEGTKGEFLHIPVILTQKGINDAVYNDFYIGKNAEVTIIAGCGIHNSCAENSQHDGIHSFFLEKGAKVKYVEKHYGEGAGTGKRILNPKTIIDLKDGSSLEMDSVQIKGVSSTIRETMGRLANNANLIISEKIMTHENQYARTEFEIFLEGKNASSKVTSRSVAKDNSKQEFISKIVGNAECFAHVECDAILADNASVKAVPEIYANHVDARLVHEAAIGKIAGEQLTKLMTFGLTKEEAEIEIINGFLK